MQTSRKNALSYLALDRQNYDALLGRLVGEVKAKLPDGSNPDEAALKEYFAVALTKGADFSKINFEELGTMSPTQLAEAAEALPDKLSEKSRKHFDEAAQARTAPMRWNKLFTDGKDEIVLSLEAEAQSVDERIAVYIENHNQQAATKFAEAQAKGEKDAGRRIEQQKIRRDPSDPAKLQIINPIKPTNDDGSDRWMPGPRLGKVLEDQLEWALLDDFSLENSRKQDAAGGTVKEVDHRELLDRKGTSNIDQYDPNSLRIVITRDPQKVGEMSSGQHWQSCMSEGGMNFHYVPKDIEAGSLAAYLVCKDDLQARHPLMRQLLKPYYNNQTGETALIPAKVYGADTGGNSRTRQALHDTLSQFVREHVNAGKAGEFIMDSRLYGDGQPGLVNLQAVWNEEAIKKGLIKFHDSSMREWLTEVALREKKIPRYRVEIDKVKADLQNGQEPRSHIEELFAENQPITQESVAKAEKQLAKMEAEIKTLKGKIKNLNNPEILAKGYHRETRKSSPDSLPESQAVLDAAKSPELVARAAAIHSVVVDANSEPLSQYLESKPLKDRIETARKVAQFIPDAGRVYGGWADRVASERAVDGERARNKDDAQPSAQSIAANKLWEQYVQELPTAEERVAEAQKVVSAYTSNEALTKAAAGIIMNDIGHLQTAMERIKAAAVITSRLHDKQNLALADRVTQDMATLSDPRERMDAANIAFKAIGSDDRDPDTVKAKVALLDGIHHDLEAIPKTGERIEFAIKIFELAASTSKPETESERSDHFVSKVSSRPHSVKAETLEHAKKIILSSIPAHYEDYDADGLEHTIKRIKDSNPYRDDKHFAKQLDAAADLHTRIVQMGKTLGEDLAKTTSDAEREEIARKWADEVRQLPNYEVQLSAVMYSRNSTFQAKIEALMAGKENPLKSFEAEAGKILVDIAPKLPPGLSQATAFANAASFSGNPAVKDAMERKFVDTVSDESNNLKKEERIMLFQHALMGYGNIDLDRPIIQDFARLTLKFMNELERDFEMVENGAKVKAISVASASMMAKPGSDVEHNAAIQFRKHLEAMPVEERRVVAHEAMQMMLMIRDHPKNISKEKHGEAVIEQAKAVLEGKRYEPVERDESETDRPRKSHLPSDHTARDARSLKALGVGNTTSFSRRK